MLCLLDLTAAFDTVNHDLLLHRFQRQFGLRGILAWFRTSARTFEEVISSRVWWLHIFYRLRRMLSSTKFRAWFTVTTWPSVWGAKHCDERVLVSLYVCLLAYLKKTCPDLCRPR